MGQTPLLGWPIADASEAPANHAAHMQALGNSAETFSVGRFTDPGDRDARITTPVAGMLAWVDTPGEYTWHDGAQWVPLHMPRQGAEVYTYNEVAGGDLTFGGDVNDATFGQTTVVPVPDWARVFGAYLEMSAMLHTPLDGTASFQLQIESSIDGGANYTRHKFTYYRGTDVTTTATLTASRPNVDSIDVRVRIKVWQRFTGTGSLRRDADDTNTAWTFVFYPRGNQIAAA